VLLACLETAHLLAKEMNDWLRLVSVPSGASLLRLISHYSFPLLVLLIETACSFAVFFFSRIAELTILDGTPAVAKSAW